MDMFQGFCLSFPSSDCHAGNLKSMLLFRPQACCSFLRWCFQQLRRPFLMHRTLLLWTTFRPTVGNLGLPLWTHLCQVSVFLLMLTSSRSRTACTAVQSWLVAVPARTSLSNCAQRNWWRPNLVPADASASTFHWTASTQDRSTSSCLSKLPARSASRNPSFLKQRSELTLWYLQLHWIFCSESLTRHYRWRWGWNLLPMRPWLGRVTPEQCSVV